jgi:hypothetical protein
VLSPTQKGYGPTQTGRIKRSPRGAIRIGIAAVIGFAGKSRQAQAELLVRLSESFGGTTFLDHWHE